MSHFSIAWFGDVVGVPGRRAFPGVIEALRARSSVDLVIANAENARHGSGLHPDGYRELRKAGIDVITLGDHWARDRAIIEVLESEIEPVARPANLASKARGKRWVELPASGLRPPLCIVTVLGRLFMPLPSNDPFETVDEVVAEVSARSPETLFLIEVHAEATSEKVAMAWHCSRNWSQRVVAIVGTHTHVQTADARIVDGSLAAITDLGMTGPHRSILGRQIDPVLQFMTTQHHAAFDVADQDVQACGCVIRIDAAGRRAVAIESFRLPVRA